MQGLAPNLPQRAPLIPAPVPTPGPQHESLGQAKRASPKEQAL